MRRVTQQDVEEWAERQSAQRTQAVRRLLIEKGDIAALADFDRNMKELRLGVTAARNTWHSISLAQRRVIETLVTGRYWLVRWAGGKNFYDAHGEPHALVKVASLPTVRNLAARGLIDWDGTATDPEKRAVLSDRGRFVWKHGRPTPASSGSK